MGYRDDFYKIENIIGITGPIESLPSVYFQDKKTGEFGHITQIHGCDWNQGRSTVQTDPGYQILNACGGGCSCKRAAAHEYNGQGRCFHPSRSLFVASGALSKEKMEVVAQAIWRCPLEKTDPLDDRERDMQDIIYTDMWRDAHQKGPGGRRNAIDYTGQRLANPLLKIVHPTRV
ncbi:hypothetical protein LJR289_002240 [Pseudoduganella sp. LjRoot289]|uniref:hypothetical protein n=1 Tax=Pseudoduganella sp. LjRoot289 TaxID=3342314 RepID=UPI003ECFC0C2